MSRWAASSSRVGWCARRAPRPTPPVRLARRPRRHGRAALVRFGEDQGRLTPDAAPQWHQHDPLPVERARALHLRLGLQDQDLRHHRAHHQTRHGSRPPRQDRHRQSLRARRQRLVHPRRRRCPLREGVSRHLPEGPVEPRRAPGRHPRRQRPQPLRGSGRQPVPHRRRQERLCQQLRQEPPTPNLRGLQSGGRHLHRGRGRSPERLRRDVPGRGGRLPAGARCHLGPELRRRRRHRLPQGRKSGQFPGRRRQQERNGERPTPWRWWWGRRRTGRRCRPGRGPATGW